jgi:hypothetical protein
MYVQPLEGSLSSSSLLGEIGEAGASVLNPIGTALSGADNIARIIPPEFPGNGLTAPEQPIAGTNYQYGSNYQNGSGYQYGMFGPLASMMQQLMSMLSQFMGGSSFGTGLGSYGGYGNGSYGGYGGCGNGYSNGTGGCSPYGNEQYYGTAQGQSIGDPHLEFNGQTWDNMGSQPDLLNSTSIPGGYNLSTQATAINAQGKAYNQSATVTLNNGATSITLDNAGNATISQYGQTSSIADGQTIQLGNGQSVTRNQNGSLSILSQGYGGGSISTTLTDHGQGVNVNVNAQNVELGGYLVNGNGPQMIPEATSMPFQQPPYLQNQSIQL